MVNNDTCINFLEKKQIRKSKFERKLDYFLFLKATKIPQLLTAIHKIQSLIIKLFLSYIIKENFFKGKHIFKFRKRKEAIGFHQLTFSIFTPTFSISFFQKILACIIIYH